MLPLEGIKVVDLTSWAMAPASSAAMADWGANVIKVEEPETGDLFRWFLMNLGIDEADIPVSLYGLNNRNKRGMAVDLKTQGGREIMYKLIEDADVFVSNIPAASLKRMELDYEKISSINPRLVYAHASGFGHNGPDISKPGFDATAYWARSGLMAGLGVDQPPIFQQFAGVGDQVSGLVLFGGIMLALYERQNTGQGRQVDVSLFGVGTWVTSCPIQMVLSTGEEPPRAVRSEIANPMINYYQCQDGSWLTIVCLPDEPYWSPLCRALDLGDLETHPKFSSREARLENNVELISILDKAFMVKDRDEWGPILDEHGVVWTHIPSTFAEVINDPQIAANDHIVEVDHPEFGPSKILTTPIRLDKQAPEIRTVAPELGQHNEEILLEHGYTWDDIIRFKDEGAIP